MKRRYLLTALAVIVPIVVFVPASLVARWRPVALKTLKQMPSNLVVVGASTLSDGRASSREITWTSSDELFDLQSGQIRVLEREGITADGTGFWRIDAANAPNLMVARNGEKPLAYPLPAADFPKFAQAPTGFIQDAVTVTAGPQRVELVLGGYYCRWNTKSRVLENTNEAGWFDNDADQAISRDGETVINATPTEIITVYTRSGKTTRHAALPNLKASEVRISTYGTYAIYTSHAANAMVMGSVVETASARVLWQFQTHANESAFFSPDEKYIAIGRGDRKIWEIHDIKTGEILRTLSLVSGATSGAFSPDGATLYSVANGVLYKQRAR